MKSNIKYLMAIFTLFLGGILSAQDNVEKTNKADNAKQELNKTEDDSVEVYQKEWTEFKKSVQLKIDNNERRLKELRKHITADPTVQDSYNKKIEKLTAESEQLKRDLKNFNYKGKEDWLKFKKSVNSRIDKLGDAIDVATE